MCIKGICEMKTITLKVDNSMDNKLEYQQAVDTLKLGEVIAFPTETVYGLGADATNEESVAKIYEAKGRPSDNPLIIHIGTKEEVVRYAKNVSDKANQLMEAFWPGPLTLVFDQVPNKIAANALSGVETVGIRMPDHPVALNLLQLLKLPLAAPSANRSGKPSPTEAAHVEKDLDGRIPLILDGGKTGIGLESTVIDMTTTPPTILRPGGITKEMIEAVIGPVESVNPIENEEAPRSPGMKYVHYAPEAPVFLIRANKNEIEEAIRTAHREGKKIAVIGPNELEANEADWYFSIGAKEEIEEMATNLYQALRQCDDTNADLILAVETNDTGVGAAFMNRLHKAANGRWYRVKS